MADNPLPSLMGRRSRALDIGDTVSALQRDIEQVLEDFGRSGLRRRMQTGALSPRVDVTETKDDYVIEAELPGIAPEDVEVALEGDVLSIKGEKRIQRDENIKGYHLAERSQGQFERMVQLPFHADADTISASFDKGVLKITLPKPEEAKAEKKTIQVTTH